jgi:hypothetical protein
MMISRVRVLKPLDAAAAAAEEVAAALVWLGVEAEVGVVVAAADVEVVNGVSVACAD